MTPINILIAEDNIHDFDSIFRKLNYLGSIGKIIHVLDGEKALEYLFTTGEYANAADYIKPDLMLLDIRMPKVSGQEVLETIKADGTDEIKKIPVIIFTNAEDNFTNKKCFELGARGFFIKPVGLNHLEDMLIMLGLLQS